MLLQHLMAAATLPGTLLTPGMAGLPCFVPAVPPAAATQLFHNPLLMGRGSAGGDAGARAEPVPVPPPLRN